MKILIMGFTKIKYMPYLNFYFENIDSRKNEVHILYWNRDLQVEDTSRYNGCIFHEFRCYQEDDVSKISKIRSFIKYRKYVKNVVKKERFDFILVLHSLTGILVGDILRKYYAGQYVFDYRDSTYERFLPFKKAVGSLVKYSSLTFVSSDAFRRFLPIECSFKIYTSHNLVKEDLSHRNEKNDSNYSKIRIAFWGIIRNEGLNKEIIQKISCDSRLELHYYGREQKIAINLKQYAKELKAKNVFFHGEYNSKDRYEFVKNTDIIHNIYFDNNMMLAMANKYYDGLIFRLPQLCMEDSFMGNCVETAGVGFSCNPMQSNFIEDIYAKYKNLNVQEFNNNCDIELERVLKEYDLGVSKIKEIFDMNEILSIE